MIIGTIGTIGIIGPAVRTVRFMKCLVMSGVGLSISVGAAAAYADPAVPSVMAVAVFPALRHRFAAVRQEGAVARKCGCATVLRPPRTAARPLERALLSHPDR